jgi:hypothetical protein
MVPSIGLRMASAPEAIEEFLAELAGLIEPVGGHFQWRLQFRVAEKVGVVKTAANFFKKRAGKAAGEGLMKFLRTAPNLAPEPEDTLR